MRQAPLVLHLDQITGNTDVMLAKLLNTIELRIRDIDLAGGLRTMFEIALISLIASFEEVGL